jgi:signal recognition particle receptor subunit beta
MGSRGPSPFVVHVVVAVNRFQLVGLRTAREIRAALCLPTDVAVHTCDAREPDSVHVVLDLLLTDIPRRFTS